MPANEPAMLTSWLKFGEVGRVSMTLVKKVAELREFSGRVGARKPFEAVARMSRVFSGVHLMPTLGEKALPKSLYLSWRPASWTSRFFAAGTENST